MQKAGQREGSDAQTPCCFKCRPQTKQHLGAGYKCRISGPTQTYSSKIYILRRPPGNPCARWCLRSPVHCRLFNVESRWDLVRENLEHVLSWVSPDTLPHLSGHHFLTWNGGNNNTIRGSLWGLSGLPNSHFEDLSTESLMLITFLFLNAWWSF